jgi:hypothetical protein
MFHNSICHQCENGFMQNARSVFLCKENISAHDKMDGYCYETYFAEELLPNCPSQPIFVVDSDSYQCRRKNTC